MDVSSGPMMLMLVQLLFVVVPFVLLIVLAVLGIRLLSRKNAAKKAQWKVTSSDGMVWIADGEKRTLTAYRYNPDNGQIEQVATRQLT
jgi:hypothetical protein